MKIVARMIPLLIFGAALAQAPVCWGWGGGSFDRTTTPVVTPEQGMKKAQERPKPTETGVGRYEVTGVDYYLDTMGSFHNYAESDKTLAGDSDKNSVIVIRGTIHGDGVPGPKGTGQAAGFHPFFKTDTLLPGLPQTCTTELVTYPQSTAKAQNYVTYLFIKDTAGKPECWEYFRTLTTIPLELKEIKIGTAKKLPPLPVINGGTRTLTLGPLLPKSRGK